MSDYTVTITGATGKTGRLVAAMAAERGWQVRAASRRRPPRGRWVSWDWDDEDAWATAFAGSHAAYVVIPFNHPGAPERAPRLLRTAATAGVGTVALLSSMDVEGAPADSPLRAAEKALRALPVRAVLVRPTWFMDNFTTGSLAGMTAAGELRLPAGDARIPYVDVRDVAAVAVAALAPDGPRGALPVTGPEAVDHHQVAAALGTATGRPVTYVPVPAEEFVDLLSARGFSREYGQFLADALTAVATGRVQIPVVDTVEHITGRRPYTVLDFARHHAATARQ